MIKFIKNFMMRPLLFTVVALMALHPAAAQQTSTAQTSAAPDQAEKMLPVPPPPLEHLEKKVAEQLQERKAQFDTLMADPAAERPTQARVWGDLGLMYHAYELYESAEACYRNALILDPESYNWNYSLGYLLQKTGKFADAIPLYQTALKIQQTPDEAALVNIRLGECYLGINKISEARAAFEQANNLNPEDPVSLARLGEAAFKAKQYEEAVQYLERALEKQPAADKLHYTLAMAYRALKKMDLAREHLAKRGKVGLQPPDPLVQSLNDYVTGGRIHVLNARMAFSAGRYDDAAQLFRKAVDEQPDDAGSRVNLGVALSKLGKHEEALARFREAVELDPNSITAHFDLGSMLLFQGKPDEALASMRFVVQQSPKDATATLFLANALRKTTQFSEAVDTYQKALDLDGDLVDGWLELSNLYDLLNQPGEAMQTLEEAYSRLPKQGAIVHALARELAASPDYRLRDGTRSLNLALAVYRAKPDYETAKTVAMAYAELGLCGQAFTWIKRSIKLATNAGEDLPVIRRLFKNMEHLDRSTNCRIP